MNNTQWRFPLLDGGSEQGFNNGGIATFKGSDLYDNLAREICQNSLDAKRTNDSKVKLEFQIKSFEKKKYNALQDLDLIFDACEKYWQNKKDTRLVTSENSKAERKKQYQESKARGLYSEYDLE